MGRISEANSNNSWLTVKIQFQHKDDLFTSDLSKPIDISIGLGNPSKADVLCYYAPSPSVNPVRSETWVGTVKSGFPVNFFDIKINPHGNGTHTECYGHISKEMQSVSDELKTYHFLCQLISIAPKKMPNGDLIFTIESLKDPIKTGVEALVIRSLPNNNSKLKQNYSGTNPPYFSDELITFFRKKGIKHLLIDLPSIDKEQDGGLLKGHKAFWLENGKPRMDCTITELIYVPSNIKDGFFLLNLQLAPIELDASPSRPVLFKLIKE